MLINMIGETGPPHNIGHGSNHYKSSTILKLLGERLTIVLNSNIVTILNELWYGAVQ